MWMHLAKEWDPHRPSLSFTEPPEYLLSPSPQPGQRERKGFSIPGSKPRNQGCRQDDTPPQDLNPRVDESRLNDSRTRIRARAIKCFMTLVREQITQSKSIKICNKLQQLVMAPIWQLQQKKKNRRERRLFTVGYCPVSFSFCVFPFSAYTYVCTCVHTQMHRHTLTQAHTRTPLLEPHDTFLYREARERTL